MGPSEAELAALGDPGAMRVAAAAARRAGASARDAVALPGHVLASAALAGPLVERVRDDVRAAAREAGGAGDALLDVARALEALACEAEAARAAALARGAWAGLP